jgi:hypothetical protein
MTRFQLLAVLAATYLVCIGVSARDWFLVVLGASVPLDIVFDARRARDVRDHR